MRGLPERRYHSRAEGILETKRPGPLLGSACGQPLDFARSAAVLREPYQTVQGHAGCVLLVCAVASS